jgi:hypothetical protein
LAKDQEPNFAPISTDTVPFFTLAASFIGETAKVVPATHASAMLEVERAMIPSTFGPVQSETKRIGVNGQR